MPRATGDSPPRPRTRAANVTPAFARLRRIRGLAEALARASGGDAPRVPGARALSAACAAIDARAAGRHGPFAPLSLIPLREGRRVVAMGLAPDACLVALARAVLAGRQVPVLVRGACPATVAERIGLRFRVRRPWARDPAEAARLESAAADLVAHHSAWCARSMGDPAWHSALVIPKVGTDATPRIVTAIVVTSLDPLAIRVVALEQGAAMGPMGRPGFEAALSHDVSAGLAAGRDAPTYAFFGDTTSAWLRGVIRPGADAAAFPPSFHYRMDWRARVSVRAALCAFRRTLPADLSGVAGLTRSGFDSPGAALSYLEARIGWPARDHGRILQAFSQVPWLLTYHEDRRMLDAARAGSPIEAILRAATGIASPLHPKACRSLRGTWRMPMATGSRTALSLACETLDALYRGSPHHPVLTPPETRRMTQAIAKASTVIGSPADLAALTLSLRREDGRIGEAPPYLRDLFWWLHMSCIRLLTTLSIPYPNEAPAAMAARIAFPSHRRLASLAAMSAAWHGRAPRLATEYNDRLAQAQARAEARNAGEVERLRSAMPEGPAHFLDGSATHLGVEVRPLLSVADLVAEGRDLGHCIGSYEWAIESGRSLLVGLTSPEGRSSAEIQPSPPEGGSTALLRIEQHRGPGNGEPPAVHAEALAAAIAAVPAGLAAALLDGMARRAEINGLRRRMGLLDLSQEDRLSLADLAMEQLRPCLHGTSRRLPARAWTLLALAEVVPPRAALVAA